MDSNYYTYYSVNFLLMLFLNVSWQVSRTICKSRNRKLQKGMREIRGMVVEMQITGMGMRGIWVGIPEICEGMRRIWGKGPECGE